MALIGSHTLKVTQEAAMSDSIAKEDIVVENVHGQQVVVVAAGQPIPDDVKAVQAKLAAKAVAAPAENKARQAPAKK